MASKSIIDIEIRDEAFKAFTDLFKKYETALGQMPSTWAKMNKEIAATSNPFKKIDQSLKETKSGIDAANASQNKFRIFSLSSWKSMSGMAKDSDKIKKSIKESTLALSKWAGFGGIFAGGAMAGTLFMLDRLAIAASEGRRSAQGLGISTGQHQAAQISYGRVVDVDSLLARINEMQHDLTQAYKFGLAGLSPNQYSLDKKSTDILPELLIGLRDLFIQVKGNKQILQSRGALDILSYEELQRLSMFSREELTMLEKNNQARRRELELSDETQKKWQDMSDTLTVAKVKIETVLIDGLYKVATGWGLLIDRISEKFNKSSQNVILPSDIPESSRVRSHIQLAKINLHGDKDALRAEAARQWAAAGLGGGNKFSGLEAQYGLPAGTLSAIEQTESAGGRIKRDSSAGAQGPFQFMPSTSAQYGLQNPYDEMQSADAAARYMRDLLKKYHGDMAKSLATYNSGSPNYGTTAPRETQQYVAKTLPHIAVNIYNQTGGDMFRTVNGMSPQ